MKKGITLFLLASLFFGCGNDDLPKDIIGKEKMEKILWDVLRADEMVDELRLRDTSFNPQEKSMQLYRQIYSLHNVTADKFKKSFQYYQKHPQVLKVILDSLRSRTIPMRYGKPSVSP